MFFVCVINIKFNSNNNYGGTDYDGAPLLVRGYALNNYYHRRTYNIPITYWITYYLYRYAHVPPHIYRYNTTRVDVHICVYTQGKGVAQFMTRTRFYTIDCIYLYNVYLDIMKPPIKGAFFQLTPKFRK